MVFYAPPRARYRVSYISPLPAEEPRSRHRRRSPPCRPPRGEAAMKAREQPGEQPETPAKTGSRSRKHRNTRRTPSPAHFPTPPRTDPWTPPEKRAAANSASPLGAARHHRETSPPRPPAVTSPSGIRTGNRRNRPEPPESIGKNPGNPGKTTHHGAKGAWGGNREKKTEKPKKPGEFTPVPPNIIASPESPPENKNHR